MVALIAAIIGLFVWQSISGKKKQKEAQDMVNSLKVGDRVKTIGGVCGFVVEINDGENTFVLETGTDANKSYVKFDKGAIYQTAPAQSATTTAPVQETVKVEEKVEEEAPVVEVKEEVVEEQAKKKTTKKKADAE